MISLGLFPNLTKQAEPPLYEVPRTKNTNNSPISRDVKITIEQKYNQCLEQNLVNITNKMSGSNIQIANIQNQAARVQCKIDQFMNSIQILSGRAGKSLENSVEDIKNKI